MSRIPSSLGSTDASGRERYLMLRSSRGVECSSCGLKRTCVEAKVRSYYSSKYCARCLVEMLHALIDRSTNRKKGV